SADALERVKAKFEALSDWNADELQKILEGTAAEMGVGMGKVCMPLRVAVTGGAVSPEMNVVLELVGKERVLSRVSKVIELLKAKAAEQPAEA
ncbi:MAG: glutamate--tRNA ligase, partial [Succinivibrionaceae bacterium]|nr:glutamate--tRNA ligase [Succinivibrionaceae bacterium]